MLKKLSLNANYIVLGILLLATILRTWNLNIVPPGLTPDEVSLGYNAYSILKTGKDEYGKFLPVIFKSFGDYKPGLYVYLTVPAVALLGLNEWSVRLPSALAGVTSVFLLYLILKLFVKNDNSNFAKKIPIIGAFLLAISPWHIQFSRGAWEVNVALTLTLAGIYFFLLSLEHIKYMKYSAIFFALTFLTYQGAKLSSTIVILLLSVVFWKDIVRIFKTAKISFVISVVLGVIIIFPILLSFLGGQTGRLEVFSVFSYPRPEKYLQDFLDQGDEKRGDLSYYVNHSEKLDFTRGVLGRWYNHFSGRFLFFEGDWPNPRHTPPNHGVLALFDLILIPVGLYFIVQAKKNKLVLFSLAWLFLAPLPSALSRDSVQAVRAFNMLIPFVIISSYGAACLMKLVGGINYKPARVPAVFIWVFILLGSFVYYLDAYFTHLPTHNARYWEFGMKEVVQTVLPIQDRYDKIIVQQSYAQPYIYFLFYGKYDPKIYQGNAKLVNYLGPDVGLVEKLDNIEFSFFSWPLPLEQSTLAVGTPIVITDYNKADYDLIKNVKYPNGDTVYKILASKNK